MAPSGPVGGLRAWLALARLLAEWEQGIADALLQRRGLDPARAPEPDRLGAVITACAATSALRGSVQVYRSRYPTRGIEPAVLLPIIEQAFAVLESGFAAAPPA